MKNSDIKGKTVMKMQILLSFACSLSLFGYLILPIHAQQILKQPLVVGQEITIPQDTAVVIYFPISVTVDVGQNKDYPLTVSLSSAIKDAQGNVIVPEDTPVSIVLKPIEGGAKIVAQSLVVNGRIVAIQASSQIIPGTTITHKRANEKAIENGIVWGRIVGNTWGFLTPEDPDQFDRGAMLGKVIGLLSGLLSPENTRVVEITESSVYVLSLEAPISIFIH